MFVDNETDKIMALTKISLWSDLNAEDKSKKIPLNAHTHN